MNKLEKRQIPFSPPDITDLEIKNVVEVLKSGWITTGPKTKEFERRISEYCGTKRTNCLNSATACMEMCLRMLGVGPGDEVITSAYTYTASASVIEHVGAKIVLVDVEKGSYHLSYKELEKAITPKTKVIIPVDIAGVMCDYDKIFEIVEDKKNLFNATNEIQESFGRIIILADAAHSFGATYKQKISGNVADFTSFSFHAVKNLTTAEGGALTWKSLGKELDDKIYNLINTLSLHGQTKDALSKSKLGSWEYDIISTAYKCNMTDIQAAIGLAQLNRYNDLHEKRRNILSRYNEITSVDFIKHEGEMFKSSFHLMMGQSIKYNRNELIQILASKGISTNVHYKPLPLLTAYKNMGFEIEKFPNALNSYNNEISFPLHTLLSEEDLDYIIETMRGLE
ncbi:DegT/DnrJ/EryC1/StrS family aminotransferase [Enterococcus faecium]|uniref:DegT/DnrJ/EryC1/StrS family aminotransferase n=3 Tax=Enterococcus TaxID=1350 RepID=A0AAJ1SM28_9ENTE|nr:MULTISPECIES: DegT/DnrJ/EryC1/StrS family aminotransferase [Enterococcus]EMF0086553.1 DegT/DnrJ/EryC1/StrS family aminotransferase [Enterococcus hirae]MDP8584425.1 DegT/DnrJ/EryC1/StrS family aminotransferase [Listeria innocua]EGP4984166.1 DegT/DnrJ/EryC1/StrS family aminotransferase [Enterococcus faecium]EGP5086519.1 DegT/DnrJ/EryC1/StrS family aminotransferase [Enterococcus faecium]EME3545757.1 DegT/DnrJ/EryC1/StrS family aminotransferase [Enterococcus faecium]